MLKGLTGGGLEDVKDLVAKHAHPDPQRGELLPAFGDTVRECEDVFQPDEGHLLQPAQPNRAIRATSQPDALVPGIELGQVTGQFGPVHCPRCPEFDERFQIHMCLLQL
jgi:hypothetical protein